MCARVSTLRLFIVAASVEMVLGLSFYLFPEGFTGAAYSPLRPHLWFFTASLVAGGVVLLVQVRYPLWPPLQRLLALPPSAPLLGQAALLGMAEVWSAMVFFGLLGMAVLVAPWLPPVGHDEEGSRSRPDLFVLTLGLFLAVVGAAMLLRPGAFAVPAYAGLGGAVRLGGAAGLVGAAALLLPRPGWSWGTLQGWTQRWLGALLPLLMLYNCIATGELPGVVAWGSAAAGLLLRDLPWSRPRQSLTLAGFFQWDRLDPLPATEPMLEAWTWVLALVVVTLGALGKQEVFSTPVAAHLFVVGVSSYNTLMHWLFPQLGGRTQRVYWHLAFLTVSLGFLLANAEPLGQAALALMAVIPPIAARGLGLVPGLKILGMGLATVGLAGILNGSQLGLSVPLATALTLIHVLVLLAAVTVGMSMAVDQRRMVQALADRQSELERAVAKLQASEAKLAKILDIAPDPIIAIDESQQIVLYNKAAEQTFGYSAQEALGQPLHLLLPPEVGAVHREYVRGFAQSETSTRRMIERPQVLGRRKNGELFPAEAAISKLQVGEAPLFISIARDVTERVRQQEAIRESEERFRSAFDHAPIGIALVDADGRFLQVNPSLCGLLGYTRNDLLSMTCHEVTHPADRALDKESLQALQEGLTHSFQTEKRLRHKDGRTVWALQSLSAVPDAAGRPLYFVLQFLDITERKRSESQLRYMANHDPLTGLFNRYRFQEELNRCLDDPALQERGGALLLLDMDEFKYVNDSLGHLAGDELLRSLAHVLQEQVGEEAVVARLGGDEFGILLPGTGAEEAKQIAARMQEAIRQHSILIRERPVGTTASMGIALYPQHGSTVKDLLAHADAAMYQAKERGRNRYHLYEPDAHWQAQINARLNWEGRIRAALEQDRFVLHCQPVVDLHTDRVVGHEVLLRMQGDGDELIPPAAFLGVAERFGLIHQIDRWVVRRAIALLAAQRRLGMDATLSVNLSGKALSDQELLTLLQRELQLVEVDPSRLVFEITETAAVADMGQAIRFIETLRSVGCRFALDDFGAGFASLNHLRNLPVDYLKIDGSFVMNLPHSPVDQQLVQGIVELARRLGKQTVAEYVDSEESLSLLRRYGVDAAQGYYLGRPRAVSEQCLKNHAGVASLH